MNKKGVLGLDTVKVVILALLVIAVVVIAIFAVIVPLRKSVESVGSLSGNYVNETSVTPVNETGIYLSAYNKFRNPICTVTYIANRSTTGTIGVVNSTTYTQTNCKIASSGIVGIEKFNNSIWNITYTYTYDNNGSYAVENYIVTSPANFFEQVPTIFVLLGVVVLILIISIIIVAVSRFTGGGTAAVGGGSGESRSGLGNY